MSKIISDKDKALFRLAMESVRPLKKDVQRLGDIDNHLENLKETADKLYLSSQYQESVDANAILSHNATLPWKRFQQLKKGQIPWEARLDLHGLTVDSAADSLRQFIVQQLHNHVRCLLVIHGKGGYDNEPSVIKSYVNQWLKQIPDVVAFHSALPREGGSGAVYVLLKKNYNKDFD